MYVKENKAYATLTDVKNKTGDVFALADEYGEVTITSYNKSKYAISRLLVSKLENEPSELDQPAVEPEAAEVPIAVQPDIVEVVAMPAEILPEPIPEIAPVVEPVPEAPVPEPELPPIEIITSNGQTERVSPAGTDIVGIFAGLGADSIWDRNNRQERAWIENTHKLL